MAIKDLHNKNIGFFTTLTNSNVDATHLPIIMQNSGGIIISYNASQVAVCDHNIEDNIIPDSPQITYWHETPHMWLGGEHIASGYGQDSLLRRNKLTYISDTYNAVLSYIYNEFKNIPITYSDGNRSIVLKDNNNYISGSYSIGLGNNIYTTYNDVHVTGTYNYYENPDISFAHGIGEELNRKNAIEIHRNGDIYVYNIGNYNGKNSSIDSTASIQSYISNAYSYITNYSKQYTEDYTNLKIKELIGNSPETLDTLEEIANYIHSEGDTVSIITQINQIKNSYVTNSGNIETTYVSIGNNNITTKELLTALLEKPIYKKPVISYTLINTQPLNINEENIIQLSINKDNEELLPQLNIKVKPTDNNSYLISYKLEYSYNAASYLYYPQLNNIICYDGWYNNGIAFTYLNLQIPTGYEYKYKWDNEENWALDFIVNNEAKIPFAQDHSLLSIILPNNININNIYYKNIFGEQNFNSDKVSIEENNEIIEIDFGGSIQGDQDNYIKFTIN